MGKRPNTEKQIQAARQNMIKINKEGKNRGNGFDKKPLMGNHIIKHHNDLQHGAIRPDDITLMTHSKHARLHMNLHIENGTRPDRGTRPAIK